MFNRSGFNQTPFNRRGVESAISYSSALAGVASLDVLMNADMTVAVHLTGEALLTAVYTGDILVAASMTGVASISAVYTRERGLVVPMQGIASLNANLSRFHIDYIEFDGTFAVGDRIVIDSNTLTVTINGQNALQQTTGDFFDLALGANKITYTDTAGNRNVILRVTHRDKYV